MKAKINFVIFLYFFVILISVLFLSNPYLFPDNVLRTIPESQNVQCDATISAPEIFDPDKTVSIRIQKYAGGSDISYTDCDFDVIPLDRHFFNIDSSKTAKDSLLYEETFGVAWEWVANELLIAPHWMEVVLFEIRINNGPIGTIGIPCGFPYSDTIYGATLGLIGALSFLLFLKLLPYNLRDMLKKIIG